MVVMVMKEVEVVLVEVFVVKEVEVLVVLVLKVMR